MEDPQELKTREKKKLMHHDEQELLSFWEGWHWDDNEGGCAPRQDVKKWSTFVAPRCTQEFPER